MGYSHWDASSWDSYSTRNVTNKTSVSGGGSSSLYQSTAMPDDMNPKNITVRESRDSHDNPNSTPIIIALAIFILPFCSAIFLSSCIISFICPIILFTPSPLLELHNITGICILEK